MATARKAIEETEWVSVSEAARMLGIARPTVLNHAIKGDLVTANVAGRTVVSRESVEKLIASRE